MEKKDINKILLSIKNKFKVNDDDINIIKNNEDVIFKVNVDGIELELEYKKNKNEK